MKTLIVSMLFTLSACATAPGMRVAKDPADLKGCEGIPTFAPITCNTEKDCDKCLAKMSEEVEKLGGNAMLLQPADKLCKPENLSATPFKCAR